MESVNFGAVDATSSAGLKTRFGVQSYPTIFWGQAGSLKRYSGGRTASDLIAFAKLVARPPIASIDAISHAVNAEFPIAFAFQGAPSGSLYDAFSHVAQEKQGVFPFAATAAENADKSFILPAVVRMELGEEPQAYTGEASPEALGAWVHQRRFRTLTELGPGVFHDIANKGGKLLAIGVLDAQFPASAQALGVLRALSRVGGALHAASPNAFQAFRFASLNGTQWADYIAKYNISPVDMPKLLVLDAPAGVYYLDPTVDEQEEMLSWLQEVAQGKVPKNREGLLHFPTVLYNTYVLPHLPWSAVALAACPLAIVLGVWAAVVRFTASPAESSDKKRR